MHPCPTPIPPPLQRTAPPPRQVRFALFRRGPSPLATPRPPPSCRQIFVFAKEHQCPLHLVQQTRELGRLPVVTFAAGGIATPADVAMMMQLGVDGCFVGSGIFKSGDPVKRAKAIVDACTYFNDPKKLAEVSTGLGEAMVGIDFDPKTLKGAKEYQ